MKVKIRVARAVEKMSKAGKPYFSQAVLVSQFPRQDVTVWLTSNDEKYNLPSGVFTASLYLVERDRQVGDKTYKEVAPRFGDLTPLEAA